MRRLDVALELTREAESAPTLRAAVSMDDPFVEITLEVVENVEG